MGLIIIVMLILMGACSSDGNAPVGGGGLPESGEGIPAPPAEEPAPEEPAPEEPAPEEPAPEEPAPEEPAPEEPAPEEPAPEEPPAEETDGDGLTSEEWAVVILLGLAVVAIVAGATALASRNKGGRSEPRPEAQWRLDEVTRGCRSIHDTTVMSVLQASNPAMLQSTWGAARAQLIDLEGRVGALAPDLPEESQRQSLYELGHAVAGVRGALEANVNLRLDPQAADQADLIQASSRTALYRSEQLESALQSVLYIRL
jgi:hypothetical protein